MLRFRKEALLVFILLAVTFAYFHQDPGWNGNSRLGLTAALVREGRLTIDSFHDSEAEGLKTGDKSFYDGHYYTDKAIGSSLIAAIFYLPMYWLPRLAGLQLSIWAMKYWLTLLAMGLPSALAGSLIYLVCEQISGSKFRAFVVTLAVSLGTMSFPFSVTFIGHQLAASLLFIGFFLIYRMKVQPTPAGTVHLFLSGVILGLALITELTTLIVVLPLVLYYFYVQWKKGGLRRVTTWALPALGGMIPMGMMVGYNLLAYDQALVNGYQYLNNPFFREAMSAGFMGIGRPSLRVLFYETLHPAQGLLWQSPVLVLALVGGFFMLRAREYWAELLIAAAAAGGYLLMNSGYFMWWGGFSFAPRHLTPMLPFLALPLIFVPRRLFVGVAALTAVSVFQMLVVAASTIQVPQDYFVTLDNNPYFRFSAIYNYCLRELRDGRFAWNLGQALLGLKGWASLLPVAAVIVGATVYMGVSDKSERLFTQRHGDAEI